jgi:hypothetical protein
MIWLVHDCKQLDIYCFFKNEQRISLGQEIGWLSGSTLFQHRENLCSKTTCIQFNIT